MAQMVKNPPAMQETWGQFLGQEDPLEEDMETHSSTLAWRISWTEEPGGFIVQRVTKRWTKHTHWEAVGIKNLFFFCILIFPIRWPWFFYIFSSFFSCLFKDITSVSPQKFPRKLYFLHWWKYMEGIPLGWETVSIFSPNVNTNC